VSKKAFPGATIITKPEASNWQVQIEMSADMVLNARGTKRMFFVGVTRSFLCAAKSVNTKVLRC
jgi:hypothetical protein